GADELFSAMERLKSDRYDCLLMLLGRYEEDYEDRVNSYAEDGLAEYYGYQPDVRPFIGQAHCFILPSWHEGMANTNLECAASGRPVITTDIPGCREAVADGKTGLICKPKDADSLYEAMQHMLSLDYEMRRSMGMAGRQHMAERFDKIKVVKETLESLEKRIS
ncbi:MAG: glycosyltransferase, partial [Lachnospiraceae bacterium]|nr:glycosyltransferase [Lachnospiraceae bacterium]